MHPVVLSVLYLAILLAPLGLSAALMPRESDVLRELGIGAGLVAYSMLLMQFISSGRYEAMSGEAGIDRTMRFHQLTARAAVLLVVAHPLLIVAPDGLDGLADASSMLAALITRPQMRSGVLALALTLIIVVAGIWRRRLPMRYELWRASHALLAAGIALAGAHHTFSTGTYSEHPWLQLFWWLLIAVALGSLGFIYGVKPFLLLRGAHRVVRVDPLAPGVHEVLLEPARDRPIRFAAGQFAWVTFGGQPIPVRDNPFSISSAPTELPRLRLLIKARGDLSGCIGDLPSGTPVYLDAPHGNFRIEGRAGDALCLIAGGIGIAPVIGILRELAAQRDRRPIGLIYGARNPALLVHADEILALGAQLDLQTRFFVEEPPPGWNGGTGNIDQAAIANALRAAPGRCLCLACGPTGMMLAVERALLAAGVPAGQIVYERFDYD